MPESPRWLLSQGELQDAERVLEGIATGNTGRTSSKPILLRPLKNQSDQSYSLADLMKHSLLRNRTFILAYAW